MKKVIVQLLHYCSWVDVVYMCFMVRMGQVKKRQIGSWENCSNVIVYLTNHQLDVRIIFWQMIFMKHMREKILATFFHFFQFCGFRWLENSPCITRLLEIIPYIKIYFTWLEDNKKMPKDDNRFLNIKQKSTCVQQNLC